MYEEVALEPQREFHFESSRDLAERLGYSRADLGRIPAAAIDSFAGVGYFLDPRRDHAPPRGPAGTATPACRSSSAASAMPAGRARDDHRARRAQHVARGRLNPNNLLCDEMNGVPLPREHGFPVRQQGEHGQITRRVRIP
jgi:Oxidoreductase molybdopterin binding domain